MNKLIFSLGIAIVIFNLLLCFQVTYSKVYQVGDGSWGPGGDYAKWAKGKTFIEGDTLLFQYGEGYSVDEVTKENFKKCNAEGSIFTAFDGNTSIPLNKLGLHYFIGGAFQECDQGMNLTIIVKKSG